MRTEDSAIACLNPRIVQICKTIICVKLNITLCTYYRIQAYGINNYDNID